MLNKLKTFILISMMSFFTTNVAGNYDKLAYDFNFNDLDGSLLKLSEYKNKVIIVVNVASQCGFTNQYEDMQLVWEKYQDKGIVILGVPSNDFGGQEPGSEEEDPEEQAAKAKGAVFYRKWKLEKKKQRYEQLSKN